MTYQTTTIPLWEEKLLDLSLNAMSVTKDGIKPIHTAMNLDLENAMATCEAITAEYSRSFHLATSLLPSEKRRAMRVLYAFCRTADNLADEDVQEPEVKLAQLRNGMLGHDVPISDPVLTAWSTIHAQYRVPLSYAEQLLDGVGQDLVQRRYRTFEDLSVYCYGVASTVGLMSMHITGYSSPRAIPYAIKLGVALQLTNILRDVGEDWEAGRFYLPLDEMAAFGMDERDVAAGQVDERWREFMRFQIGRTRRLYDEAMPGIAMLHPDGRFAVAAAAKLYQGILDDIEAHDYEVFTTRAHVSWWRKLLILSSAFIYSKKSN